MGLSAAQILPYAAAAGFTGADLTTAVCVALAESGGNPNAYNPETSAGAPDGQGSFGLWQIFLAAHPEFSGWNLDDPGTNATAAFQIFSAAGGFGPWTTYTNGAYLAYLGAAQNAQASLTPALPGVTSVFAPASSVMTLFPKTSALISSPSVDVSTIALALALAVGVVFAFSEG